MLQLALQAVDSATKSVFVPVLTTGQPEYNGLTPTPTPTPEPTIEPTVEPVNENGTTGETANVEPAPVETPVG
jgi:hypothetical protein